MVKIIWKNYEGTWVREGECKHCGQCGCIKWNCPHFKKDEGGMNYCDIYEKRDKVCLECSRKRGKEVTHRGCIYFPISPLQRIVKEGICGFKFVKEK